MSAGSSMWRQPSECATPHDGTTIFQSQRPASAAPDASTPLSAPHPHAPLSAPQPYHTQPHAAVRANMPGSTPRSSPPHTPRQPQAPLHSDCEAPRSGAGAGADGALDTYSFGRAPPSHASSVLTFFALDPFALQQAKLDAPIDRLQQTSSNSQDPTQYSAACGGDPVFSPKGEILAASTYNPDQTAPLDFSSTESDIPRSHVSGTTVSSESDAHGESEADSEGASEAEVAKFETSDLGSPASWCTSNAPNPTAPPLATRRRAQLASGYSGTAGAHHSHMGGGSTLGSAAPAGTLVWGDPSFCGTLQATAHAVASELSGAASSGHNVPARSLQACRAPQGGDKHQARDADAESTVPPPAAVNAPHRAGPGAQAGADECGAQSEVDATCYVTVRPANLVIQ
jgi:hypothetical protein